MKAQDIISKLVQELPIFSDYFTPKLDVISLTYAAGLVTAETSAPHGFANNDLAVIVGALEPLQITSLTQVNGIATAVTAFNHDLTEGFEAQEPSDAPNVLIQGATDPLYNGSHALLSVPNRKTFTFAVDPGAASPDIGAPELLEDFPSRYNGQHVVTVIDATHFSFPSAFALRSPAAGSIKVAKGSRVGGAVDFETAEAAYTVQATSDDFWAFVVLEDTVASKERREDTDATFVHMAGTEFRQRIITPFSVYVFAPCSDEIAGRFARDKMHDVRIALFKVLLRAIFSDGLSATQRFTTAFNGDGFAAYRKSAYIHRFVFEVVSDITYGDTCRPDEHVAFRDLEMQFNDELGTTELSVTVDLDDQPL